MGEKRGEKKKAEQDETGKDQPDFGNAAGAHRW